MREIVYNIYPDGSITGIYNDFLSEIDGKKEIQRISEVEFDSDNNGWVVSLLYGKYKGCCLPKLFTKRNEAIEAEINFFNTELFN